MLKARASLRAPVWRTKSSHRQSSKPAPSPALGSQIDGMTTQIPGGQLNWTASNFSE